MCTLPNINIRGIAVNMLILIDGLTNLRKKSGHDIFTQCVLDQNPDVTITWKPYYPVGRLGKVETTEVFPFFFGIEPYYNPGRAGFEMYADGDLPASSSAFITIRSPRPLPILDFCNLPGIYARSSFFSNKNETILVAARSNEVLKNTLQNLATQTSNYRLSHYYCPANNWLQNIIRTDSIYLLIGWCHGALRSALGLVGIKHVYDDDPIQILGSEYTTEKINELAIRSRIYDAIRASKIPIIYFKHHAYEARHGLNKTHAAKETALLTCNAIKEQMKKSNIVNTLVISDHNSEIGIDATYSGKTVYGLITNNNEDSILFKNQMPDICINQAELVRLLSLNV